MALAAAGPKPAATSHVPAQIMQRLAEAHARAVAAKAFAGF